MTGDFYAQLAADYDRVIRWERRLGVERPWFEALWQRFGVRSVLDASCGTGHHLVLFAEMGLSAAGADASAAMVDLARERLERAGLAQRIPLVACKWSELAQAVPGTFDAVLCIGNSLPYVTELAELERSLQGLWSRVAPGGFLLLQMKNFEKLCSSGQRFLPLTQSDEPHETVALRFYDYCADHIDFNVVLLDKLEGKWSMRHQVTQLEPYTDADIEPVLCRLGAQVSVHGDLALADFDDQQSDDLVVLASRPRSPDSERAQS